jgi:hypothetical protein
MVLFRMGRRGTDLTGRFTREVPDDGGINRGM